MNTGSCRCLFIALWVLVTVQFGFAEEATNVSLVVLSAENQKPLPNVNVKITPLQTDKKTPEYSGSTDFNGLLNYAYSGPCLVQISHLGYYPITDTLLKAGNKKYSLFTNPTDIHDVVVTGQYTSNSIQKSVYEVKIISPEELKSKGANNLREALQNKLNFDLGQDPVFGSSLGINGISGEGVKIMVDGIPVIGRMDGKLDLSQITLNNIDHIEIVEGPLSVVYGTDAMGGVINIITKTYQAEKVNLNLKGYYETVGQYNVELNSGFAFKNNQLYLSGGRNFFNGFTTLDSVPRFKEWKPKEQYFADAKYIYKTDRLRFALTGSFFREFMLGRGAPRETLDDAGVWTYVGEDVHYLVYRPRAAASFMYRFKESNQLDILLGYSGFYRFTSSYVKNLVTGNDKLVNGSSDADTSRYHQLIGRATYTLPALKYHLNFQFGIDINQEFIWQNRIAGEKKQLGDYAAFGSIKIGLAKGLDVQPAIRFAYNTLYKTPLIPSLNLKYNWNDKVVFRAGYGRGFRSPSIKELFMDFVIDAHTITGNPTLKSEDGHNANASINYYYVHNDHILTFGASGFFNYIFNKIDLVQIPSSNNVLTFEYMNYKTYSTYGGQTSLLYSWKRLQAGASAQITGYKIIYSNSGSNGIKTWSPDFSVNATYRIPVAEISVYVSYKLNGIKPLFSVDNQFHAGTRDAYHLVDLSLSRSFWENRIQLTIGGKNLAGVENVTTHNVQFVGHNANPNQVNIAWGRTFFTSLILHFSK